MAHDCALEYKYTRPELIEQGMNYVNFCSKLLMKKFFITFKVHIYNNLRKLVGHRLLKPTRRHNSLRVNNFQSNKFY